MPKKKWLLGVILATIVTLIAGTCSMRLAAATTAEPTRYTMSSSTAADEASEEGVCTGGADEHTPGETYTAPAPTKCDRPGTDQDGYYIPKFEHPQYNFGDYRVNDKSVFEGFHQLKSGTSSVTVTTDYDSGTWTFNFTDTDIAREAVDTYGIEVSDECKVYKAYGIRYREAWWTFTNTLETDLPEGVSEGPEVHSIYPAMTGKGGNFVYDTPYANHIKDGQTVRLPVLENEEYAPGLTPNTYKLVFWRADSGMHADVGKDYIVKKMTVEVPSCDVKPGVDPGFSAEGSLKRLSCSRMQAIGDARNYSDVAKVNYRVVKRLGSGYIRKRPFSVDAGKIASVVVGKPPRGKATFILRAKQPNGGWVKLDRKMLRHCR